MSKDTKPTPLLKKGDKNKPLKQHMFTQKYHLDGWWEGSVESVNDNNFKKNREFIIVKVRSTSSSNHKNQRLVSKYYGLVEVIHKIMKTSYRIQFLLWMRTNPVVHVSNLKRYYSDQEDIKQKQVVWRHAKKKKFQAKKVWKTPTEKTWRVNEPRSDFQQLLVDWKRLLILRSAGIASRDLKLASSYNAEFMKSWLIEISINCVGVDVTVMIAQGVLSVAACCMSQPFL